jgi:hypothetical protein
MKKSSQAIQMELEDMHGSGFSSGDVSDFSSDEIHKLRGTGIYPRRKKDVMGKLIM